MLDPWFAPADSVSFHVEPCPFSVEAWLIPTVFHLALVNFTKPGLSLMIPGLPLVIPG